MDTNRRRISGRLKRVPRGIAIITDAGEHWVLDDCEPAVTHFGTDVTAEGVATGLDRLRVEWIGHSPQQGQSNQRL